MYPSTQLLIDGKWGPAASGRTIPVLNPATEEQIGEVAHAGAEDLDRALAAARKGFEAWRKVSPYDRAKVMRKAADLMRARADDIARLMTLEQGKPLAQSKIEAMLAGDIIDWFAEEGRRAYGRVIPARADGVYQLVIKEPVGPVAAFTPWNFPINQVVRKLCGAVTTGCSIIIKAPEETPASPAELIRAFVDAGLPPGVVNLVYGVPAEISEYLIAHPVIRKVTFTGSTPVGKLLAGLAGNHIKRVTLELGGHAPVIVCADADIERTVAQMVTHKFRNAGQACLAPTRFYVERTRYADFVDAFVAATSRLVLGDGLAPTTQMGPLANARRQAAVRELIAQSVRHGAQAHAGPAPQAGFFAAPTVLTGVTSDNPVLHEEPFGPIACILPFEGVAQAIEMANASRYGLAGYLFTDSARAIQAVSQRLEVGSLAINGLGVSVPEAPFGGVKDSGYGSESGIEGMEAFLDSKFMHYTA